MGKPLDLIIDRMKNEMLNELIEVQSLNIAKIFGYTKWFIIVSLIIVTVIYIVLKYKKISLKYFLVFTLIYFAIFGFLFVKGIRIKNMLDTGEEIIKNIYDYKKENLRYPNSLNQLNLQNKLVDSNVLTCCVEYEVYETTQVKIEDEKGYHYEKIPVESFTFIIRPDNYFRYFVYDYNEKEFIMTEIKHLKKTQPEK